MHFFEFEGEHYVMDSFGYPSELTIYCDYDVFVEPPIDGNTIGEPSALERQDEKLAGKNRDAFTVIDNTNSDSERR